MKKIASFLIWVIRLFIFFVLFAFALNNQENITLHFFFGYNWTTPTILIILVCFVAGVICGILGMLPHWWRQRREAKQAQKSLREATDSLDAQHLIDSSEKNLAQPDVATSTYET